MTEDPSKDYWEGHPLELVGGLDPYGIKEIVIEFDTGDEEVLKPRIGEEFGAYDLEQAATYTGVISGELRARQE